MKWLWNIVLCLSIGLGSTQLESRGPDSRGPDSRGPARQQEDPCNSKFRIAADVEYCDRYWECVGGHAEQYNCPNGLVYVGRNRGIAEGCDYPWRAKHSCVNKQLANPPISNNHCDWLYGIFGHETSCTRYWSCWNGTFTEQFCIGGLLYSEEEHSCDWPSLVPGCQKHPLCSEDPEANVPLGKSCERYWACQGGYPRLQRCPATLVFDKISRRCVHPPTEDCDVPTTPIPLDEEGFPIDFGEEQDLRGGQGIRGGQGQGLPPRREQSQGGPPPRRRPRPQIRAPPTLHIPENARPINLQDLPQDIIEEPSRPRFREPPIEGAIPFN